MDKAQHPLEGVVLKAWAGFETSPSRHCNAHLETRQKPTHHTAGGVWGVAGGERGGVRVTGRAADSIMELLLARVWTELNLYVEGFSSAAGQSWGRLELMTQLLSLNITEILKTTQWQHSGFKASVFSPFAACYVVEYAINRNFQGILYWLHLGFGGTLNSSIRHLTWATFWS